jgi:hypothetical protein
MRGTDRKRKVLDVTSSIGGLLVIITFVAGLLSGLSLIWEWGILFVISAGVCSLAIILIAVLFIIEKLVKRYIR